MMTEINSPQPDANDVSRGLAPKAARKARWWPAVVILAVGISRLLWVWLAWQPDSTMQMMHTYMTIMPMVLSLGIWWSFFSRLQWRVRFIGWGLVVLLGFIVGCVVRIDDVTGDVVPILAWRWTPRRQAAAAEYFKKAPVKAVSPTSSAAGTVVDSATGPQSAKQIKSAPEEPLPLKITAADWPEYRGRDRDGIVHDVKIRTDWETQPPRALWRHPVGLGWSSFVVVDGLAFTQEQREENEVVVCYDVLQGTQVWIHEDVARFKEALGGDGPRATPTLYDGRLYVLGATGILNCLEPRTGKKIWSHDVLVENAIPNITWGMSGSPLVYDDVVVINAGGPKDQGLMAFDRLSGKPLWHAGVNEASYCAPQLSTVDGVRQILLYDAVGIAGHDVRDGHQLWSFPWTNQAKCNASQPFVPQPDQVLISAGYGVGSALLKVKHEQANWTVTPLLESKKLRLKFNSGVLQDHYVYGLDEGVLACFDLSDSRQKWKGGRYSFGQILLVGEWLIILAETGEVALVKAVPEAFTEVARFQAIDGKTWNNPAIWKGLLLVRNSDEAACYDLRPAG